MSKVIREILRLVWKVMRLYLWKLLLPHLRKLAFVTVAFIAILGVLTMLIASSC